MKWEERLRHLQQRPATIPVLYIGGVRLDKQRPAICIDQGMALAAFDLFSGIIAPRSATFSSFHALAIDDGCGRTGLAANTLPICRDKSEIDLLEKRAIAKAREPAVDCLPGW